MVSQPDPFTGLQVTREFSLDDEESFSQRTTFANVSDRIVCWSIWEVVQVPAMPGEVQIDVDSKVPPTILVDAFGALEIGPPQGGTLRFPIQPAVAKRGFPNAAGRIAYLPRSGPGIELSFLVDPAAEYPDQGSRVEVWMQTPTPQPLHQFGGFHPTHAYLELEILTPLHTLGPGESAVQAIGWKVA
jgi:hypothetical protein